MATADQKIAFEEPGGGYARIVEVVESNAAKKALGAGPVVAPVSRRTAL